MRSVRGSREITILSGSKIISVGNYSDLEKKILKKLSTILNRSPGSAGRKSLPVGMQHLIFLY